MITMTGYIAHARGVFWDRVAWTWRMQDGHGNTSTHDTWSAAQAELHALETIPDPVVVVTWAASDYPPEGVTVDLSTIFPEPAKEPRKARKRKGKRK